MLKRVSFLFLFAFTLFSLSLNLSADSSSNDNDNNIVAPVPYYEGPTGPQSLLSVAIKAKYFCSGPYVYEDVDMQELDLEDEIVQEGDMEDLENSSSSNSSSSNDDEDNE